MSKIISVIINFLNRINKIIWNIIIFLSKFIKVDEINHLYDNDDVKYRSEKHIIERFNHTLKYYYRPKGGFYFS